MDIYDRLQREDLMQAAVVVATFAYAAAMRDELLPRKPQPPVAAPAITAPALKPVKAGSKGAPAATPAAQPPAGKPAEAGRPRPRAADDVPPQAGPASPARPGYAQPVNPERVPAIKVLLLPKDTNALGTIFGGVILSHIDLASAVEARKTGSPALGDQGDARGRVPRAGVPRRHRQLLHRDGACRPHLDHRARVRGGRALGRRAGRAASRSPRPRSCSSRWTPRGRPTPDPTP